ncbi:IS3 family transposase [Bifidobacterium longum subsp. longum]|nr:IS3 family transposase [Bifidobacterium longum subsp. longum]
MLEHPEAERADPYEKDVERVWRDSGKVYGARKIRHALGHEGVTLSRRRINRIMKGNGMAGSYSKAAYRPRPARPDDDPAPNILAREFNGYAPRTLYLVKSVFRVSHCRSPSPKNDSGVFFTAQLIRGVMASMTAGLTDSVAAASRYSSPGSPDALGVSAMTSSNPIRGRCCAQSG